MWIFPSTAAAAPSTAAVEHTAQAMPKQRTLITRCMSASPSSAIRTATGRHMLDRGVDLVQTGHVEYINTIMLLADIITELLPLLQFKHPLAPSWKVPI